MQFTTQTPQLTTCPQCDNIVRVDADFCNICGQQLKPASSDHATPQVFYTSEVDDEAFEEEDETPEHKPVTPPLTEIFQRLQRLQEQSGEIEDYFPAHLENKEQKLLAWKKQLQRALACAKLFERPQMRNVEDAQALKLRQHLAEAARTLDFTREYSVKLIGHAGAGKSTLMAGLLGQDIFPRLAGGAVTGVRTRVRICKDQEPEQLRIRFLTRESFTDLLAQTEEQINKSTDADQRAAYEAQHAILSQANETVGRQYLRVQEPYIEALPRERWQSEASRYIEEPARDSREPRLVRLVDYVEYTIHPGPNPILPPGSVLVDLPGGSAAQIRHDEILRHELNHVDAILLVIGNNRFGDDERTRRMLQVLKRKVLQKRSSEVASEMLFIAVTHWDEISSTASLDKALGSLRPLLNELPANYNSYHHHGYDDGYFFYPIRALDGLLSTLGSENQPLGAERQQEGRDYAGRILGVYPELLKLDAALPDVPSAQAFDEVSQKQHEAMLNFSGLDALKTDLQKFLSGHRYEVQLRQAETQLAMALQLLEDLCWEHLNNYGVHSNDLLELEHEMRTRQSRRGAARFELLQKRTQQMHTAWDEALDQFDMAIRSENNAFYQALQTAHDRAARRIKIRIMQGHFDCYIKVAQNASSPAMEIGNRWTDIDGWSLIRDLRIGFSTALEREMNEPARTLAEAFLIPVAHREEIEGTLDIQRVSLNEVGGELDEIQKAYNKLKRSIREKARDVCLYVTMGELLNEEKYAPGKDDPAVSALYRLIATPGSSEDILQQARQLMAPILDVLCSGLALSTEQRIAHIFRYELDKLQTRQIFENDRLDALPVEQAGSFTDLVNRLYSLLTERVVTSEQLRQFLDALQSQREATVDNWARLVQDVETLKTMRHQPA